MGWLLISIILPLVAPICALLFLRPLPLPPELAPLRNLVVPIKDGQLCWVAIALRPCTHWYTLIYSLTIR
jgi:hypothetical protein